MSFIPQEAAGWLLLTRHSQITPDCGSSPSYPIPHKQTSEGKFKKMNEDSQMSCEG